MFASFGFKYKKYFREHLKLIERWVSAHLRPSLRVAIFFGEVLSYSPYFFIFSPQNIAANSQIKILLSAFEILFSIVFFASDEKFIANSRSTYISVVFVQAEKSICNSSAFRKRLHELQLTCTETPDSVWYGIKLPTLVDFVRHHQAHENS